MQVSNLDKSTEGLITKVDLFVSNSNLVHWEEENFYENCRSSGKPHSRSMTPERLLVSALHQ